MKKITLIFLFGSFSPSFAYASDMGGPEDLETFIAALSICLVYSFIMSFDSDEPGTPVKFRILKFLGYAVLSFIFALIFGVIAWLN